MVRRLVVAVLLCTAVPAFAVTRSWTGATSANWSEPTNWSPNGLPAAADSLEFPAGAANRSMTNDLPAGTTFGSAMFRDVYGISGNAMTLSTDWAMDPFTNASLTCNANLTIAASLTISVGGTYNGAIDVNGHTLTVAPPIVPNTTLHTINGSGTLVLKEMVSIFSTSGNFSGTITGPLDFIGSLPNAVLNGSRLTGNGTLGAVSLYNSGATFAYLIPGGSTDYAGQPHAAGTFRTGSLTLTTWFLADLMPDGTSDQMKVTGSVSAGGYLHVYLPGGPPPTGQSFKIIDNDGTDPVAGTFNGLPEGSTFAIGPTTLRITYAGGDGNDVVISVLSTLKSWTGAVNGNWSDPNNWSPAAIPAAGEELDFPAGAANRTMTNDLPAGTAIGKATFHDTYGISGNAITLSGEWTRNEYAWLTCNADLKLAANVRLGVPGNYNGAVDVNGHTLTVDPLWQSPSTTLHTINGNGALVLTEMVSISSTTGTFSGTISGPLDFVGSLPNATLNGSRLTGNGTLGAVSLSGFGATFAYLIPGASTTFNLDPHTTGTFQTGSLSLASVYMVDLMPDGSCDRMKVTGSVTAGGSLHVYLPGGQPSPGQTFKIIDNDGSDPVAGTFSGLPEGSTFVVDATNVSISYAGGDGNDVVLTVMSSKKTWTGAVNGNWSNPNNWSPAIVPAAGEELNFPAGAANRTMMNDLAAGTIFGPATFRDVYAISGNAITLSADWTTDPFAHASLTCNADLKIGASLTIGVSGTYNGAIDVNGHTLTVDPQTNYPNTTLHTVNGSGALVLKEMVSIFNTMGNFSGTITGPLDLVGTLPNASLNGSRLTGNGTIGAVSLHDSGATYAYLIPGGSTDFAGQPHVVGTFRTGPLTLAAWTLIDLMPDGTSDEIKVSGAVTTGGILSVSLPGGLPPFGQSFTIIDNDGTDAVIGTFNGLPEGATTEVNGATLRISYAGGDGNDVVIMRVAQTTLSLTQDSTTTRYGEPVTFTATIAAESGTPTGTVTFHNGASATAVPLQNGIATFTTSALATGPETIYVTYDGGALWLATTSQSVSHTVSRADTATTLTVTNPSIVYGNASHFAVAIAPPGTGNVSLTIDGTNVGTTTLTAGTAIFDVPLLGAGTHSISASYAGDTNFNASTSAPAQEIVAKAATSVSGSAHPSPAYAGMSVGITATVHATAAATPTGSIAAAISIRSLTTQSLTGGSATLTLSPLPVGQNTITLTYSGDGNFEPSSTTINETVLPPAISASDVTTTGDVRHSITVPLTLSAPMSLPASVDFATNDATAHAGTEYVAAQGSVSIPAGQTSATLTLDIVGNASAAPLTFSLRFSKPVNASLLTDSITVTINGSGTATTYEYAPGLTIDLYGSSGRAPALPLILAIPGTSAYDSARGAIPALRETARGYAVARIAYTAAPSAHFPAQLDNLAAAVAWIRDHASMLNIDPTRIGAWGYGSGANLAALLGTSDAHLVAVIEESGATDLPSLAADSLACNSGDHSAESDLLGCALDACGAAASPTRNASAASAATLIIHGENDCVVGPEQATRLYDALRNAGVYTFLDLVRNGGHEDASGNADVAGEIDSFLDVHLLRLGARPRPSRH